MASDQMLRRHVKEAQKKCFQMPNFWLKVFVESKMLLWEKVQLSSNGQNFKSNHSENTKKLKSEKKSSEILFLIFFSRWRPRTFSSLRWPKQLLDRPFQNCSRWKETEEAISKMNFCSLRGLKVKRLVIRGSNPRPYKLYLLVKALPFLHGFVFSRSNYFPLLVACTLGYLAEVTETTTLATCSNLCRNATAIFTAVCYHGYLSLNQL